MKRIREFWYFEKEEDARKDNISNAVGYEKFLNDEKEPLLFVGKKTEVMWLEENSK